MVDNISDVAPLMPSGEDQYMRDLYEHAGLPPDASNEAVRLAASEMWERADSLPDRMRVGELLLGHQLAGHSVRTLPSQFLLAVCHGADFDVFVAGASTVAQADARLYEAVQPIVDHTKTL